MDGFLVVTDELRTAQARVSDVAGALAFGVARASDEIDELLDGSWSGAAAAAFGAGWAQWQDGAAKLADALARMGTALAETAAAYAQTDESSASTLSRLNL